MIVAKNSLNLKKDRNTFKKSISSRAQVDSISKKNKSIQVNDSVNNSLVIKKKEKVISKKVETIVQPISSKSSIDDNKRMFLKVAGVAGLGLAASTLFPKGVDAYVSGSTPTSNVVGLKDATNVRINPATEETLDTLLKPTDLDFDGSGYLNVNVQSTSASGASSFSDSGDVSQLALIDVDRHVQVDVLSSALPASASTETTLQTLSFGGFKFALRMATVGNFDYVGEATIGSATSSAVWRIKRIDNTSGIVITWAGTGVFDQVWDNYPSLTYL